jgi:aromatic-L-amino-acid decarboxylase
MDSAEFKSAAKDMVEFVTSYLDTVEHRPVLAQVEPGYIKDLVPDHAPEDPEPWSTVLGDIERVIMPGVTSVFIYIKLRLFIATMIWTRSNKFLDCIFNNYNVSVYWLKQVTHWHSPHFHAFYPTANSYPAMLGDMLSDAIACIGFTWVSVGYFLLLFQK